MQCDIGIIGDGIVGKTAALGFAQAGFQVVLLCPSKPLAIAKANVQQWDTRVYAFNHTTKNLLDALNLWHALDLERVTPIESMRIIDALRDSAVLNLDAYTAYQSELAWIVEDQNINHVLDSALRFTPNVTVVIGKSMEMSTDFSALTLEDGRQLCAQLWVGADGANSWLRHQAQIDTDYRSYGQRGIVANFSCAKPHHHVAYQWFAGDKGVIALLPLTGNQVSLVWSVPDELATVLLNEDAQQLSKRLMPYCVDVLGELMPLPPQRVHSFPLNFVRPHRMIGPQLALIGDAAHVIHPLAGYGLNLGFGDVKALLEVVTKRESWRSCGDARVLERYARARKEDVLSMQWATDGLVRLYNSSLTPIQLTRQLGMKVIDQVPFFKRQLIQKALGC